MDDAAHSEVEALRQQLAQVIAERDGIAAERDGVAAERDQLARQHDGVEAENRFLRLQVKQLAARLYGRKSERLTTEELGQLVLKLGGTEAEANADDPKLPQPERADAEPDDEAEPKKRRKRTRKMTVADHVERVVDATIEVPEHERACRHCGCEMAVFDYLEHERIEYVPAKFVVARYLRRRGLLSDDGQAASDAQQQDKDGEQLALSALADAAVTGTSIAGPASRQGRVVLQGSGELARSRSPLCATLSGFSLHARTTVGEGDKAGRERLIKYILRPPLASDRVQRLGNGRVRLQLKRAFGDGTFAVEMDELSLVARLAAMVPPPWQNQVRYSGVLAPAATWRSRVVAMAPGTEDATPAVWQGLGRPCPEDDSTEQTVPKGKGCRYWPQPGSRADSPDLAWLSLPQGLVLSSEDDPYASPRPQAL